MSKDFRMFTNVICITGEDKNPCGGTKVKIHWAIQKFDFLRARSWTGGRGNLFFHGAGQSGKMSIPDMFLAVQNSSIGDLVTH